MDFEFDHGWEHVIDRIEFNPAIKHKLIEALVENECGEEIYSVIDNINPSDFKNIESFIDELHTLPQITHRELSCIVRVLQKSFFWTEIFEKFKLIETKKWHELEKETFGKNQKSKNHWVDVEDLIKPARVRLHELKMDDQERLYSMRLTATQRVWGIRMQNYYRLLWFDFDHQICPSLRN